MTKDTAKKIGLIINLVIVSMIAFNDDYIFKTGDFQNF